MGDVREYAKKAVKRMNKVRNFPDFTCSASRHVARMTEALAKGKPYPMLQEEPEHCAGSLSDVVAALREARAKIAVMGEG